MQKRYAIGDIHGCIRSFRAMIERKLQPENNDVVYLLGDYIDRGPDSKAVVDYIHELQGNSFNLVPLMGNHEYMLIHAMNSFKFYKLWMINSGFTTLKNFGIHVDAFSGPEDVNRIPVSYVVFFRELHLYAQTDGYFITHACFDGQTLDPLNDVDSMIWRRYESYNSGFLQGRILIHGHTPSPLQEIRERVENPESLVINLDGGCVYNNDRNLGYLVALDLDSRKLFWVKNLD